MASCCKQCFEFCFGHKTGLPANTCGQQRPLKTVRRISSVGQTVIDEYGEEQEIPRHSNILQSYDGVPVPWCTPTTIQPGVSKDDVVNRIKALPTIVESPPKPQKPKGWRKALSHKKDYYSPVKQREKLENKIQMKLFPAANSNLSKSTELISCRAGKAHSKGPIKNYALSQLRRGSYGSSPNLSITSTETVNETTTSNFTLNSSLNSESVDDKLLNPLMKSNRWQQSQSMEDVNKSGTLTAIELAKQYGLDLSLYTEPLDYPDYKSDLNIKNLFLAKPEGTIELVVSFHEAEHLLTVFIKQIKGLSGLGPSRVSYSAALKLQIPGNKKHIKNGKKLDSSLHPMVNQCFTFHVSDIELKFLRITVFNSGFLGRNDSIGHSLLALQGIQQEHLYSLKIQRPSYIGICPGVIEIAFLYKAGFFYLTLNRIFNLIPKYVNCKMHTKISHYSISKKTKEKIYMVQHSQAKDDVILNHYAKFRIDSSGLKHDYIVISVKSGEPNLFKKSDQTIGRVILGPSFYYEDDSQTPWGTALSREGASLNYSFKLYL